MFVIQDIIELAIQIERNGEAVCRSALKKGLSPRLASVFKWMADEELKHIEWFQELKESCQKTDQNPELEQMGRDLLNDILGRQSFSLGDADLTRIQQVEKLLLLLIEFENDTILFYEMIGSVLNDEETLELLDRIIQEEKRHRQMLQGVMNKEQLI